MSAKFWTTFASVVVAATTPVQLFALDETYLRCKGTITIHFEDGVQTLENEEIAAHIDQDRINFTGNMLIVGPNIPICTHNTDGFYFDTQSCVQGGPVDPSKPRRYGTFNKITGEVRLSNDEPKMPFAEGRFNCKATGQTNPRRSFASVSSH